MKTMLKKEYKGAVVALLLTVAAPVFAAGEADEVITVSAPKAGAQLVETWAEQYAKLRPDVEIRIVGSNVADADLRFVTVTSIDEVSASLDNVTYVGRYALLTVVSTDNPLIEEIKEMKFGEKELKRLFFHDDGLDDHDGKKKKDDLNEQLTVYTGSSRNAAAEGFASHFGRQASELRGKRIAGDDIFLLTAISKDNTGVTFNNLTYLFDLDSRQLKPHLTPLRLDLKKEQSSVIADGKLDDILLLLETENIDLVPVDEVGFIHTNNQAVIDFLGWLLTEGQQFNHSAGFLTLTDSRASYEQKRLEKSLLSNR